MNDFYIDQTDLKQLEKYFKDSPRLLQPITANVLTTLAFDVRKLYLRNIERSMIMRNRKFVESSLRVQKARSGPIERQIAYSGSVERPRFTGWREQQYGQSPRTKRAITTAGRRGSKRHTAISKARLKTSNKFYKPQQFAGSNMHSRFMFMMRVLNTRGGGEIIIDRSIAIRKGKLQPGLYQLKNHKFQRLQVFGINKSIKIPWMSKSNQQLKFSTNLTKLYRNSLDRIIARYK
jgi:hypothetical protein